MRLRAGWLAFPLPLTVLALGLTALSATGCGNGATEDPVAARHRALTGPMGQHLRNVLESRFAGDCERSEDALRTEIVAALDARYDEIEAAAKQLPPSNRYHRVTLGPTTVLEPVNPVVPPSDWKDEENDWSGMHNYYDKIKGEPVNKHWVMLDAAVRAIIVDDEDRVLYGRNDSIEKDSGPGLQAAIDRLSACLGDSACDTVSLEARSAATLSANPFYAGAWRKVTNASGSRADGRDAISSLLEVLKRDYWQYGFNPNSTVTRPATSELRLPLVAGPFAGAEAALAGYIQSMWKSDSVVLQVQWVENSEVPDAFKILLGEAVGGRSYVSPGKKIVQLFPDVRTRSIAHEIGHVLGFPDHYYTTWHGDACKYIIQSNAGDLMSDPEQGVVVSDEWVELERRYPAMMTPTRLSISR